MIDNKTITAVLFVYNEERYLSEMLESILEQTVVVDKIIVIDDHSTDNTRKIIESYQQRYSNISYGFSKRKGKPYALETGLEQVSTDLFFVCAGDDKLMSNYVEYMYNEMLVVHKIPYCYAKYVICDEDLQPKQEVKRKLWYSDEDVLFKNHLSGYLFGFSTIIQEILPLPDQLQFEDWYIVMKLTFNHKKSFMSKKPVFLYRRHGKSTTTALGSREKYLGLIKRDISFLSKLSDFALPISGKRHEILTSRITYLKALTDFNFGRSLRLLTNPYILLFEKVKLIVFPLFVSFKYRH